MFNTCMMKNIDRAKNTLINNATSQRQCTMVGSNSEHDSLIDAMQGICVIQIVVNNMLDMCIGHDNVHLMLMKSKNLKHNNYVTLESGTASIVLTEQRPHSICYKNTF